MKKIKINMAHSNCAEQLIQMVELFKKHGYEITHEQAYVLIGFYNFGMEREFDINDMKTFEGNWEEVDE